MESAASTGLSGVHFTERCKDWCNRYPLFILNIRRLSVYLALLVFSMIIVWMGYPVIGAGQMLMDNVRISLSILVQTQGAVIAIVITLTLIAVQTTAATSSARLVHYVVRRNPDVWMLLFFYIATIFYGLWVLHNVTPDVLGSSEIQIITSEFRNYVFAAYALGIFTFIALIPYFWRITNLLQIDYLLNNSYQEINDEMILKQSGSFLLFFDLLLASAVQHNFSAMNSGLDLIANRMAQFIDAEDSEVSKEGVENICNHMIRLGQVSTSAGNDTSTLETIRKMYGIGEYFISKRKTQSTIYVVRTLFFITKSAIDHKQYQSSQIGVYSLGQLGQLAEENDLFESADYVVEKLCELGPFAAHSQIEWAISQIGDELTKIGNVALKKGREIQIREVIISLSACLDEAIKRDIDGASIELIKFFGKLGVSSAEQKRDLCTALVIGSLIEPLLELILKRRRLLIFELIRIIDEIQKRSRDPVLSKTLVAIAETTQLIVDKTKDDELFRTEIKIIPMLDSIGKSVVTANVLDDLIPVLDAVGNSLRYIGKIEIKKGQYDMVYQVAKSLFEITQRVNERKLAETTTTYMMSLISLGQSTIEKGAMSPLSLLPPSTMNSKEYLLKSELELIEKNIPFFIIDSIVSISTRSGETQQKRPVYRSITGLVVIGLISVEKEYDSFVEKTVIGLIEIGSMATNQKMETIAAFVVISLNRIGEWTRKHNRKNLFNQAALAILFLGIFAKTAGMDKPMDYATTSFAEIALTDETLISSLILSYQEKREIATFDIFKSFVAEYERKLAELKDNSSE